MSNPNYLNKLLILLGITLTGCQMLGTGQLKSEWSQLKEARSVSCEDWPRAADDLRINSIYPIHTVEMNGFIYHVTSRSGAPMHYYVPGEGADIDLAKRVALNWGSGARFLSFLTLNGVEAVLIVRPASQGKKILEIRDMKKNIVLYRSKEQNPDFYPEQVNVDSNGFWLSYKLIRQEQADEDLENHFVYYQWRDPSQLILAETVDVKPVGSVRLLQLEPGSSFVVWFDEGVSTAKKEPTFKYLTLEPVVKKPQVFDAEAEISRRVESWSADSYASSIYLTYVTGDTLLWQNASLQMIKFTRRSEVEQRLKVAIQNEHVGDPFLIPAKTGMFLAVSKWLDHESSVGLYRVGFDSLEDRGLHGIYPERSYLKDIFYSPQDGQITLLRSQPKGFSSQYQLCEIDAS